MTKTAFCGKVCKYKCEKANFYLTKRKEKASEMGNLPLPALSFAKNG
jgi:hypothetical protein